MFEQLFGAAMAPDRSEKEAKAAGLAAAKDSWARREAAAEADKVWLQDRALEGVEVPIEGAENRAVHVRNCTGPGTVVLPQQTKAVKLFVERCEAAAVVLDGQLLTGYAEVWRCKGVRVDMRAPVATVQLDLVEDVTLRYASSACVGAIVHAAWKRLRVEFADGTAPYEPADASGPADEQFITRFIDGALLTEKVVRGKDEYPSTERELAAEGRGALSAAERGEAKKAEGNTAFKEGNFSQAAVLYTEALDADPKMHLCLANRSACWMKLGHHDKALDDAEQCTRLAPDFVKGHFRMGVALHALGRYEEALPALGRAEQLDPKNAQVKDAINMAQMRLQRGGGRQ